MFFIYCNKWIFIWEVEYFNKVLFDLYYVEEFLEVIFFFGKVKVIYFRWVYEIIYLIIDFMLWNLEWILNVILY